MEEKRAGRSEEARRVIGELDRTILKGLRRGLKPSQIAEGLFFGENAILFRLEAVPDASALAGFAGRFGVRRITDAAMAEALHRYGDIRSAAKSLRVEPDLIEERLGLVEKQSPLWRYRNEH